MAPVNPAEFGSISGKVVISDLIVRFFNPSGEDQFATVQYVPNPDLWMISTNDTVRDLDNIHNPAWIPPLLVVFGVLLFMWIIACLVFTIRYWSSKLIRSAASLFLLLILTGCTIQCSLMFLPIVPEYPIPKLCMLEKWFDYLGFTLAYGALLIKTYRVKKALDYRSKAKLDDQSLILFRLLPVVLGMTLYMLLWTFLKPATVTYHDVHKHCSITFFDFIAMLLKVGLLCVGIYLAVCVRNAPSAFNEAFYICLSTYWNFILLVIVAMITLFMQGRPGLVILSTGLQVFLSLVVMLSLLWIPKMLIAKEGKENAVQTTRARPTGVTSMTSRTVDATVKPETIATKAGAMFSAALGLQAHGSSGASPAPTTTTSQSSTKPLVNRPGA